MDEHNFTEYWDYRGGVSYEYKGETFYAVTPIPFYHRRRAALIKLLEPIVDQPSVTSICGFGCGDGWYLQYLFERHPEKRWSGVDLSETMLAKARKACPAADLEVCGSGIPFDDRFDLVYTVTVFAHIMEDSSILGIFENISEKLGCGGYFVLFEQTAPKRRQGETWRQRVADDYVNLGGACGLRVESRCLVDYPVHRFFETRIAPYYRRVCSRGTSHHQRCINANKSAMFRTLSSLMLSMSGPPIRPDDGSTEGYSFIVFRKDAE